MRVKIRQILALVPMSLGTLYAISAGIIVADVFGLEYSLGEFILAFFIRLLPAIVIFITTAIGWRWPGISALLFGMFGILCIPVFNNLDFINYLVISGPLFIISILFLINHFLFLLCRD